MCSRVTKNKEGQEQYNKASYCSDWQFTLVFAGGEKTVFFLSFGRVVCGTQFMVVKRINNDGS